MTEKKVTTKAVKKTVKPVSAAKAASVIPSDLPAGKAGVEGSRKTSTAKSAPKSVSAPVYDMSGKEVGKMNLPGNLFAVEGPTTLLAQYVRVYLANNRQGTASTKTRSEITGSTKKIYRQKGTGRARHGANKAPIFVGGGIAFGPRPHDHSLSLSKKQRTKALLMSLSAQLKNNHISVIQDLSKATGKTKQMNALFSAMNFKNSVLFVYNKTVSNAALGSSNLPNVTLKDASVLNAYDVLKAQDIVFAKESLDQFLQLKNHEN